MTTMSAQQTRLKIRSGNLDGPTANLAAGHVQANLVALPREYALDFLIFATRNPKPCPIIEIVDTGTEAKRSAPGSDLRTDLPGYRLHVSGKHVDSATDARTWWKEDFVSFLLGCSFSFEAAMMRAGIPVRHQQSGCNVPMYVTDLPCEPAGKFSGPLVVSMRPIPRQQVKLATNITENFSHAHGGPIHIGDPSRIGIRNLTTPDFGDAVQIYEDEIPMFWACGVTPQIAIEMAEPEIAVTHEPGKMFITDFTDKDP